MRPPAGLRSQPDAPPFSRRPVRRTPRRPVLRASRRASMTLTSAQRDALRKRCALILPGFTPISPAEEFRRLADWCETHAVDHDHYGVGASVEAFEQKIA